MCYGHSGYSDIVDKVDVTGVACTTIACTTVDISPDTDTSHTDTSPTSLPIPSPLVEGDHGNKTKVELRHCEDFEPT